MIHDHSLPSAPKPTYIHLEEEEEEEEDFQTISLDDEHWTTEEIPDRTQCIHEHSLPH